MKKGFTLIELLSVIVVLAIIAVIAIPTLIGVVNKVKLQSLKSSAYGLIEAGALYNAQYANSNNARFDIMNNVVTTTEENKIKYKGSVKQGTVIVSTKGKVSVCVTDGKNSAYKNYNDTEVTLVSKKTCSVPANTAVIYLDGEATIDSVDAKAILDRLDAMDQKIDEIKNSNKGGMPILDYANPLYTYGTGNLSYTATQDCWLYGSVAGSGNNELTVTIDEQVVFTKNSRGYGAEGRNSSEICIHVGKGSTIKLNTWYGAATLKVYKEK